MISHRIRGFYELFVVLQLLVCLVFYWVHYFLLGQLYAEPAVQANYLIYCVLVLVGLLLEAIHRGDFDIHWLGFVQQHRVALRQTLWAAVPVIFFLVGTKDLVMSRLFLFSLLPLLYVVLLVSSRFLPPLLARATLDKAGKDRTLLVGSSKKLTKLQDWLARKAQLGLETVGALCDEREVESIGAFPVLGRVEDLERVIREHRISQVIVGEIPTFTAFLGKLANHCELLGVRLLVVSDLEEKFRHRVVYMENGGRHFFGLRQEPLENPFNRAIKRLVDLAVALPMALTVLPPVSLAVWFAQRFQSPGPLFYRQERSGFHNRSFQILKFRTMHANNSDPARQATAQDERVYRAGRWLRKFSLDELPQFWNVLRGEMSVVGPRPHLPRHNEMFAFVMQNYYVRSFVKPGITGLAQVRGFRGEARNEVMLRQRVESDIHYLENWSLTLDLALIARTAWQMIFPPKTAY